jgi:hypothetical protein
MNADARARLLVGSAPMPIGARFLFTMSNSAPAFAEASAGE